MLVDEVKENLIGKIIPFWINLLDREFGGFYGYMDFDLKLDKKAVKGCILNSRILWFFSNSYKEMKKDELLACANHAYAFLMKHCIDKQNGGVYWSVNYDGSVEENKKYTYNQAFAIYALAAYYEVTKNSEALAMALELYEIIETKCKDEVGYLDAFDAEFHEIQNSELSENGIIAEKTMNTLLHVFEAYTELYRVSHNLDIKLKLLSILDIFETKIFNNEKQRQEVFFDRKMNSILDLHSYGHDIETAWLIDRGCDVIGDEKYSVRMKHITSVLEDKIYHTAYDGKSVANECENGIVDLKRVWWVQAEAVVGFMNAYEKTKNPNYLQAANNIWSFIKTNMIDNREGSEWFSEVDKAGNVIHKKPIAESWKCPYHNGRMCLEIIRRSTNVS